MQDLIEFASANALLSTGLVASALAVLFYELRIKARNVASLGTSMAVRMINDGGTVVDIRTAEKFAEGHIVDAQNILADDLVKDPTLLGKKKRNTLLVCDSGARSGECVGQLRKGGLDNVFSLRGGLEEWRKENLPVITQNKGAD